MDLIEFWREHPMGTRGRKNLESTDQEWRFFLKSHPKVAVPQGTLLFRVHTGGQSEPIIDDYSDTRNPVAEFETAHEDWVNSLDLSKIQWNGHWVSFTSLPKVIGSNYFRSKGLRGFVIVIQARQGIVLPKYEMGFQENEVVAPMDKSTLKEILPFREFMDKYGTGDSDFERSNA